MPFMNHFNDRLISYIMFWSSILKNFTVRLLVFSFVLCVWHSICFCFLQVWNICNSIVFCKQQSCWNITKQLSPTRIELCKDDTRIAVALSRPKIPFKWQGPGSIFENVWAPPPVLFLLESLIIYATLPSKAEIGIIVMQLIPHPSSSIDVDMSIVNLETLGCVLILKRSPNHSFPLASSGKREAFEKCLHGKPARQLSSNVFLCDYILLGFWNAWHIYVYTCIGWN